MTNKHNQKPKEIIEVRNDTDKPIKVSACRSAISRRLYVEIGGEHKPVEVAPNYYELLEVNQVDV